MQLLKTTQIELGLLSNLGRFFTMRFELIGSVRDLDLAEDFINRAVNATPQEDADRPGLMWLDTRARAVMLVPRVI
jgi:hypothetical protein